MAFNRTDRTDNNRRRPNNGLRRRKKVCGYCFDENKPIDYKDVAFLKKFISISNIIL